MRSPSRLGVCTLLLALGACGTSSSAADDSGGSDGSDTDPAPSSSAGAMDDTAADETGGETGDESVSGAGRCEYTNPFSQGAECIDYVGAGWTAESLQADCDDRDGAATFDAACETSNVLGRCVLDEGTAQETQIVSYGDDAGDCALTQTGCETFAGGSFEPAGVCTDEDPPDSGGGGGTPFIQPTLECRDPVAGEGPGEGPDGQVCTWQLISAATEEGRKFEDYGDCEIVYTQRPYYSAPANDQTDDPRMDDPAYVDELAWVRSQIAATACTCCHSDVAPSGASNWTIDAPGNWIGTFDDTGLAFSVGWIDSTSFGAFEPEDNNGFDRRYGIPTTDPERMRAFFLGELDHRGLVEADFEDEPAFGGPLHTQLLFEPEACENGERVDRDGTVHWEGGDARYVYVLEPGSANPTVPPNLDLPEGTLWRVDVPWDEDSVMTSGDVSYGGVPSFADQRFPDAGAAPTSLVEGQSYYLYVLADVAVPRTRCIFTY